MITDGTGSKSTGSWSSKSTRRPWTSSTLGNYPRYLHPQEARTRITHSLSNPWISSKLNTITYKLTTEGEQHCEQEAPKYVRSWALNQLLHGTPDVSEQIKAKTQSSTMGAKLHMYFVNTIIDESTGEVNIPTIVNCDTGMINVVIDPVTSEQKSFRHLISDDETQKLGLCYILRGGTIVRNGDGTLYSTVWDTWREESSVFKNYRWYMRPQGGLRMSLYCHGKRQEWLQGWNYDSHSWRNHSENESTECALNGWREVYGFRPERFLFSNTMAEYKYARIKTEYIPKEMIDKYNLWDLVDNGYLYIEIWNRMYGLPQAGRLANNYLKEQLDSFGFYECNHTLDLWRHKTRPLVFTLW